MTAETIEAASRWIESQTSVSTRRPPTPVSDAAPAPACIAGTAGRSEIEPVNGSERNALIWLLEYRTINLVTFVEIVEGNRDNGRAADVLVAHLRGAA